jgi:tetratricopeptide (TPR) repeat protein
LCEQPSPTCETRYNFAVLTEIQRRDVHAEGANASSDHDAKIEQLLLVGLDHYFAAQYEHAINVWTRALFLDRNHARARAYIERARSALAERQRQSEELLHKGVAAFQSGDEAEARRLLQAAIDGGAPPDEALTVLERLSRTVPADPRPADDFAPARRTASPHRSDGAERRRPSRVGITLLTVLVGVVVGLASYLVVVDRMDLQLLLPFLSLSDPPPGNAGPPVAQDLTLPLPRRGENALLKGRALAAGGRLHDALVALEQIRPTDPQRDEADRLRSDIQRQLLALTPMPGPVSNDKRLP